MSPLYRFKEGNIGQNVGDPRSVRPMSNPIRTSFNPVPLSLCHAHDGPIQNNSSKSCYASNEGVARELKMMVRSHFAESWSGLANMVDAVLRAS
jgi:hypothetical protein